MWFAIFIVVCVAIMVDDARKDVKFMEELKKKLDNLEED
jgi:hypothetical protein